MVRRFATSSLILLAALLTAACSPGGLFSGDLMWTPHREIAHQPGHSAAGARALLSGLAAREVRLTESEVTHLLRRAWGITPASEGAVRDVRVLFERDLVSIKILLREGVLPGIPSDSALNLVGRLVTVDGKLQIAVDQIGLGVIPLAPTAALDLLNNLFAALLQNRAEDMAGLIVLEQGGLVIYLE